MSAHLHLAKQRTTHWQTTSLSHFLLLTDLSCSVQGGGPASFLDDTIARFFPLECGTRGKHFFQTPPQEFVTHFSWARTPLHGLQRGQGSCLISQMRPSHDSFPRTVDREENFQLLISRIFILPFRSLSSRDNDRLQTWFSHRPSNVRDIRERPSSLKRKRDHQTDRLG